jgi:hypothetical protein
MLRRTISGLAAAAIADERHRGFGERPAQRDGQQRQHRKRCDGADFEDQSTVVVNGTSPTSTR